MFEICRSGPEPTISNVVKRDREIDKEKGGVVGEGRGREEEEKYGSSQELFSLSSQMMGKYQRYYASLSISPESLPDKFNEFFVHKMEEMRSSFDPDRPIPTDTVGFSGTVFEQFQLLTKNFVKTVVQEMPQNS